MLSIIIVIINCIHGITWKRGIVERVATVGGALLSEIFKDISNLTLLSGTRYFRDSMAVVFGGRDDVKVEVCLGDWAVVRDAVLMLML